MEVPFRGRYTPVDILRGIIYLSGTSVFWYFLRLAAVVAFLVIFVGYAVDVFSTPADSSVRWMRLLRYSIPLIIAVYALGKPLVSVLQLYLEFGSKGERSRVVQGEISPSGLRIDLSDTLGVQFSWDAFYQKRVTADLIALRTMQGVPVIIPRSFFQSETDWQTAQHLVKNRVIEARR